MMTHSWQVDGGGGDRRYGGRKIDDDGEWVCFEGEGGSKRVGAARVFYFTGSLTHMFSYSPLIEFCFKKKGVPRGTP